MGSKVRRIEYRHHHMTSWRKLTWSRDQMERCDNVIGGLVAGFYTY